MRSKTLLFVTLLLVFSCDRIDKPTPSAFIKQYRESFSPFFDRFNKDTIFQRSRVVFPLNYFAVTEDGTDYKLSNQPIDPVDYLILDLTYHDSLAKQEFNAFQRSIQTKKDTTWVTFTGIDNGIHEEFIFELRNGKWFLVKVIDAST
ncbi:MAG: hypothetical protein A3D31_14060 [Candidatus Fluviicola riflensis]|nr:MAG: hypothetical protein CHH17_18495 [Candidatus Fluviicola riflensis]OGS78100.1 MAG: hypothetical protein A3D31_14060 [Candidatus Fluviicola riflensis]OGS85166.1 MAG: hypothetical protein A2724_10995 [Fluviicola sp. RIFCSPHIGHO2_01_FULL_43_53]OGS89437.1 MAG: hypothetical protein A3E30_05300 [Fluviicola sp. RIFCSPHIGHO2_12_FULL_43_24]